MVNIDTWIRQEGVAHWKECGHRYGPGEDSQSTGSQSEVLPQSGLPVCNEPHSFHELNL